MTIGKIQHNIGQIKMTDYILNTYLQHNPTSDVGSWSSEVSWGQLDEESMPSLAISVVVWQ